MMEYSVGVVSLLFTDIEGSTQLWERHPSAMHLALARHDAYLRAAIERHGGHIFKTVGDAFCAVFAGAPQAVNAAVAAQLQIEADPWAEIDALRVRMALHTGAAERRDGDYFGPPLNRVARLLHAAHGGQILLSLAIQALVSDHLPAHAMLRDLGEHRLRDLLQPERVFQLCHPDLPHEFPVIRSLDAVASTTPLRQTSFIGRETELWPQWRRD